MRIAWILVLGVVAAACGDSANLADPRLIAGGGVGDGAIDGKLNVYVIDGATDAVVEGAEVRIGEPGETPITGSTDSTGLFSIEDGSLAGPQTITVVAGGHVVTTWFGADGANVTVPVAPDRPVTEVPQAQLSGTIEGWADSVPDPAQNHLIVASVGYSQSRELGAAENDLAQTGNTCTKSVLGNMCDWTVNARAGTVALFAAIIDVDTKGTLQDTSDDEYDIIGFAHRGGITVEDGVDQSGLSLTRLDTASLTTASLAFPAAPAGLPELAGIVGLDLGDDGIAYVGLFDEATTTATVPALSGPFADASYIAIGFARATDASEEPTSGILAHDLTSAESIDLGEWMKTPSGLSASGGEYGYQPVSGATVHSADLRDGGVTVWSLLFLDGRDTFTLPGLDPSPLPSGELELVVSAIDVDLDPTDFSLEGLFDRVDRISNEILTFTR